MGTFVSAIDSGNQAAFWRSISSRSLALVERERLATREQVWRAAQASLADIQNRRITVVGGSRDSVALRIDGLRLVDGAREDDPILIHMRREAGAWKVDYPGLQYPMHDLRKGR